MPKISVIVVNYNGKDLIPSCLQALACQSFKNFEVILVDNGSSDGSVEDIQIFLERSSINKILKFIRVEKNLGFSGGNIEGLKYANGEYIALLNNDTEVDEKWLGELVAAMESHPDVGICASKLVVHGSNVIDSAGDGFSTFLKGFKLGEGEDRAGHNQCEYVFGACAGAALYSRKMLEEIGFLDEDFFLIHEDTDLNLRAQLAGWKVIYVSTAIVQHKVRSSIGNMSETAVYYTLRNSEFVRIKNIPFPVLLKCLPQYFALTLIEFLYFAVKHRQLKLYMKAKMDVIMSMPKMLKKRREILNNKRVTNSYLNSIMTPVWNMNFIKSKLNKLLHG